MLVKFVSWVLSLEFVGVGITDLNQDAHGFFYLAATLITDFANLVSFLSVSDSSVKVV